MRSWFVTLTAPVRPREGRHRDWPPRRAPLLGLPLTVKDDFRVAGLPMTVSTAAFMLKTMHSSFSD